MTFLRSLFLYAMMVGASVALRAAAVVDIVPSQIEISAVPGVDHVPLRADVVYAAGVDHGGMAVSSDATWVSPAIDPVSGDIVLSFTSGSLINRSYTATITISGAGASDQMFVKATVAPLNIVAFADDPVRSRVYAVQQDGTGLGSLLLFDPIAESYVGNITLGKKPCDLAVNATGTELFVIASVSKTISVINLATLEVSETIVLPAYSSWNGEAGDNDTSANIELGSGNIIYYTDSDWAPNLHVLDRSTKVVLQSLKVDTDAYGFGDIATTPDRTMLFAWAQYGWHAGISNSYAARFTINADGTVALAARTNDTYPNGLQRDPLNTPVLISTDGEVVIVKERAYATSTLNSVVRSFPGPVFSMTPGAEVAATNLGLYDFITGNKLADIPVATSVQVITSDYARLVYFDPGSRSIQTINLLEAIGEELLGREISPAEGAIVVAPAKLQWTPLPGIDRYRVYLGEVRDDVAAAGPGSPLYLGEVTGSSITPGAVFVAGQTYFWRVDAVSDVEVSSGEVHSFTVSRIATSQSRIRAATVHGHSDYAIAIELSSLSPGEAWSASSAASWVSFTNASGSTPATLGVSLDASELDAGTHVASVVIATVDGPVTIPVTLDVDPLAVTVIRSDPNSAKVYAVSEAQTTGTPRAYLLEVDSAMQKIARVVPAGRSVTDLAIHAADNRIYVTNWQIGSLLAFDRVTLELERTYPFSPFAGTGYGDGDVYRIAAGGAGRLVVEEQDQWVDIGIFDTVAGSVLNEAFVREGGGQYGADLRYYYHGENNSSGAQLLKFDTLADQFHQVAQTRIEHTSYYGSRVVVVSENGQRIFWAGGVFNPGLVEEWALKDIIYSTSATGRYAFGESKIYDVDLKQVVLGMPVTTRVSAHNSTTNRLVVQQDAGLRFYLLGATVQLVAPVLTAQVTGGTTVKLSWTDENLETGFTLQQRKSSELDWMDVTVPVPANATNLELTTLEEQTSYQFRIKADAPDSSSPWSNVADVTTSAIPPGLPYLYSWSSTGPTTITLQWYVAGLYERVLVERKSGDGDWQQVADLPAPASLMTDVGLQPATAYSYRIKTARKSLESAYSDVETFLTAALPPPPQIVTQPQGATVGVGQFVVLSVVAQGSWDVTYQWFKDGEPLAGATSSIYFLASARLTDAGTYTVTVTDAGGAVTSNPATIVVEGSAHVGFFFGTFAGNAGSWAMVVRPDGTATFFAILTNPRGVFIVDLTIGPDGRFHADGSFTPARSPGVRGTATALAQYGIDGQISNGVAAGIVNGLGLGFAGTIDPESGPTSQFAGVYVAGGIGNAGGVLYAVVGTAGNVLTIVQAPDLVDGGTGSVSASGTIAVATASATQITAALESSAASLQANVSTGQSSFLYASELPDEMRTDRLTNVSSRGLSGDGAKVMIAGFWVRGNSPRTLLIRGAGPSLAQWNVPNLIDDPLITLYNANNAVVATNDDWGVGDDPAAIRTAAQVASAFAYAEGSKDAALLVQLPPGGYTAITSGKNGTTGNILTEVYDVTPDPDRRNAVVNLSIRAEVGLGDELVIAGFVITGNSPKRVLIRAVGPTLASAGLDPAVVLSDPRLAVKSGATTVVDNDDWSTGDVDAIADAFTRTGAFALPAGSKDAVVLTTLMPGTYTVHVSGGDKTGITLAEIYQLD